MSDMRRLLKKMRKDLLGKYGLLRHIAATAGYSSAVYENNSTVEIKSWGETMPSICSPTDSSASSVLNHSERIRLLYRIVHEADPSDIPLLPLLHEFPDAFRWL